MKVEVFSPALDFTRSIMLPVMLGTILYILSWNLLPPLHTMHSHSSAASSFPLRSLLSLEFGPAVPPVALFSFSRLPCVLLRVHTLLHTGEANWSPTKVNGKIPISFNRARILLKVFKWVLSWASVMQIFLCPRANHISYLHVKQIEQQLFSV